MLTSIRFSLALTLTVICCQPSFSNTEDDTHQVSAQNTSVLLAQSANPMTAVSTPNGQFTSGQPNSAQNGLPNASPNNPANAVAADMAMPATNDGDNALNVGDYPRAERYFAAALQNTSKTSSSEGYLRTGYGEALLWQDKIAEAATQFKKARSLITGKSSSGSNDAKQQVRLSDDLAWLAQAQNKLPQSIQYAQESVQAAKADHTVPPLMLVSSLTHLGYLLDENGDLQKAAEVFTEALMVVNNNGGTQSLLGADIQEELGGVLRRMGKTAEANQQFRESLIVKFSANAPTSQYAPHPYWNDVIFRFQLGAPNCLRKLDGGKELQIVTANGVTVAATMSSDATDLVKSGRVDMSIKNDSNNDVQILPKPAIFYTLKPKVQLARQLNATELASRIQKKGEKKAKWIRFMGQDATQTMTTTMIGNGGYYGFPPVYSYNGTIPIVNRSGNMTTMMTQVPDYSAQERALAKAAAVADQARNTADQIRSEAIGPTTIAPGQTVSGALYFDVSKVQRASLQIPIGNALFEFTFPPR